MKAVYGKTVCTVWAADGGQRASAPPPARQPNGSHEGVTAEVVEGRPVTKEKIIGPTQCGTSLRCTKRLA